MGLFETISRRVQKRRERKSVSKRFRSYVDPALVEYVLANPGAASPAPREGRVEFLIALVADDDLSRLSASLAEAIEVLRDAGAWMDSISGSLLFATFGTVPRQATSDPRQQREAAAVRLRQQLGERVRIVQGSSDGITGDLGSPQFSHFGSCFLRFSEAVALVVSFTPGEVRELSEVRGDGNAAAE